MINFFYKIENAMYKILFPLLIILITSCSKTNLEKINNWLEKEEYEKLLEFSNKNKSKLTEEELYLSSKGISKFQSFLRKKKTEEKYSNKQYFHSLETKTGLKIKIITTDNGNLPTIDDIYEKSITNSKYYKNKSILDRFKYTFSTNEISENSFLLMDILEIDPRLFLQEFKAVWIESMKLGIIISLSDEAKEKFIQILHFLASKDETDLKNHFFISEGTNVNLRSGPGTENANIGKLNEEEVFQVDSDYNTTSIGNKTGKWIQIYVWKTDTVGWIFSPFLKKSNFNSAKAKSFEKEISKLSNFITVDFNDWNPQEIPDGFYGNYSASKKEIVDANIGFPIYPTSLVQGVCKKLKKDTQRITTVFSDQNSSERIILFYLKGVMSSNSKTLLKLEVENHKLYMNSKELDFGIEKNKPITFDLKFINEMESKIHFSILNGNDKEFFQNTKIERDAINSWELCIPQGKKSSSHLLLFSFTI